MLQFITYKRAIFLIVLLLIVAMFVLIGGAQTKAYADDETNPPTVPRAAGCAAPTSKATHKDVTVYGELVDDHWRFTTKVWFDRCPTRTYIRSVTYKYSVDHNHACSAWFGVEDVRINAGLIGGWNPPSVTFDCGDNDLADAKNYQAPDDAWVTCGNDNQTGGAVDIIRGFAPDDHFSIPLMSIPRPFNC